MATRRGVNHGQQDGLGQGNKPWLTLVVNGLIDNPVSMTSDARNLYLENRVFRCSRRWL